MTYMEKLLELLKELRSDIDFENEEKLIDDGLLDSFDIISLIVEINSAFDVEISADDICPENFNSIKNLYALIESYKNQ